MLLDRVVNVRRDGSYGSALPRPRLSFEVAPDVACIQHLIVNTYLIGPPGAGDRRWFLVDAALFGSAGRFAARQKNGLAPVHVRLRSY